MGLHGVSNDELAIEAFFPRESYRPGTTATLRFESALERVRLQVFHAGPEWGKTVGDNEMRGLPVTDPSCSTDQLGRLAGSRSATGRPASTSPSSRPRAAGSGMHRSSSRRSGSAGIGSPSCCRPAPGRRTTSATPTATASGTPGTRSEDDRVTAVLHRPFLNRGVPPHFRGYDLPFLHWLNRTGKQVDYLSQAELDAVPDAATLRRAYDVLVFPGHHEYVTTREYDVEGFRDRGGSLVMLSADNFCWRIDVVPGVMTRVARVARHRATRSVTARESSTSGTTGRESGRLAPARGARDGAGSSRRPGGGRAGGAFSNAGIEIDHTAPSSPARDAGDRRASEPPRPEHDRSDDLLLHNRAAHRCSRREPSRSPARFASPRSRSCSRTSGDRFVGEPDSTLVTSR